MFMPRRRSSNAYDVKDSDAALESFNPVQKAQKAESRFSTVVRTRSDVLPSVSQRQLQRKRTSEVDVGFALARDEHKKKNRRIDLTGLARVLGNRSYEDDRVLLNPRKRSKNDDFQGHSSASLIENEVKLQSPPVLLGLKRAGIPDPKVARGVAKRGYHTTSHISNAAESAQAVAERTNPSIYPTVSTINPPPTTTHPGGKMNNANFPNMTSYVMQQAAQQQQNILIHYRSQQTPMGWQQSSRPEERARIAQQLLTSLRLAKLDAPDRETLESAITFEGRQFNQAASKEEYNTAIKERMYELQQARQRNVDLPQQGNNQAGTANEFTVIAKSPPADQQLVGVTYKTGPLETFKETEPALCIKYTISEDMTKGEQARNKARLSAISDRPRILGSKRSSVLGFARGRTGIEAHRNHATLLLKDRSSFFMSSRDDLQKKAQPLSPHNGTEWMALVAQALESRLPPRSSSPRRDGIRKKNARFVVPPEMSLLNTNVLIQGGTASKDIREVTPHAPNLEGGTMSSFQMSDDIPREAGKKRGRTGARLKKTKEQKQAEKDAAAAAQAAIDRRDELPAIAPKEEARLEVLKSWSQTEDSTPAALTRIPRILTRLRSLSNRNAYLGTDKLHSIRGTVHMMKINQPDGLFNNLSQNRTPQPPHPYSEWDPYDGWYALSEVQRFQ